MEPLNVVCLKVGAKYSPEYVVRLHAMVRRYLTLSHRFVCLTDDPTGLTCETIPVTENGLTGWWHKLTLFQKRPYGIEGRILFLDLDVVIVDSLDDLVETVPDDAPFASVPDWYRPWTWQSAVFLLSANNPPELWRCDGGPMLQKFTPDVMSRFHGDQEWISTVIPRDYVWQWPDGWIVSYKMHATGAVPYGAKVVCFHGAPKPHECADWVSARWR